MSNFLIVEPVHTDLNSIAKPVDQVNNHNITDYLLDIADDLYNNNYSICGNNIITVVNNNSVVDFTYRELLEAGFEKLLEFKENGQ